ncbi:MAG: NTP transferase domain-containing protein [Chthonomonadales bacterium]|nr:NTP transferase domain-containing protein [Chthonomonadales bacterium]
MAIGAAVVLAGGAGTRMWPFADVRSKCAMPVANIPNVRRIADALGASEIGRIAVVVGPHAGSVRHALYGWPGEVRFVPQPPGGGTAGAALAGIEALDGSDDLLVVYGDTVTTGANLRAVGAAIESGADAAVLCDPMPAGDGGLWYAAETDGAVLRRIVGHDADARVRACGVVAVRRGFARCLEANPGRMLAVPVGGMPPSEPDLTQSLNDCGGALAAVAAADFVVDMDKPWHVLEANQRMGAHLTGRLEADDVHPSARVHDGAEIDGHLVVGEGSVVGRRVVVNGNAIVGRGTRVVNGAILHGANVIGDRCRIRDYCLLGERAIVGNDCIVGHGAELDGVMFDGAYLYHYCEISGVVGASVDIGAATVCGTLRFDDGLAEHRVARRRERPALGANATYFGDHSRTGVNAVTMPGARIGAYACLGAGVVLTGDLPSRTLLLLKQETVQRPWGPERYGW